MPLKRIYNFWRRLDMPLINCEINLIFTWSENCVITNRVRREKTVGTGTDRNPEFSEIDYLTNSIFKITDPNCIFLLLLYELKMTTRFWNS